MKASSTKWTLIIIIFMFILALVVFPIQSVLSYDWNRQENLKTRYDFYSNEADDIDILFMGASGTYAGISPPEIWHETGMTSFNMGTSHNVLFMMYYQLEYLLKKGTPQLVVIDFTGVSVEKNPDERMDIYEAIYRKMVDTMPDLAIKREMINEITKRYKSQKRMSYWLPLLRYHDRWDELDRIDWDKGYSDSLYKPFTKGSHLSSARMILDWPENIVQDQDTVPIELYLESGEKIVELCKSKGIDVLIIISPKHIIKLADYEAAKTFAADNNLNFFPGIQEDELKSIGLDFETDYYNRTHLNIFGQRKYSDALGKYIQDNYDIRTDHDDIKENWNEAYEEYVAKFDEMAQNVTVVEYKD